MTRTATRATALGLMLIAAPALADAQQSGLQSAYDDAWSSLYSGAYGDAVTKYEALLRQVPDAAQARNDLISALVATGQYDRAIEVGRAAPESQPVANAVGEALLAVGRLDEAAQAFREGATAGPYALTAEANLAELYFDRGEIDEAMGRFDRFIDVYNGANGNMSARDLLAVGRAVTYLGRTEPNLFQDALRALTEAEGPQSTRAETFVRQGRLHLSKYDSPTAKEYFERVLADNPRHPEALLGMAEAALFDGGSGAEEFLERLFDVNPNHVRGKALHAHRMLTEETYQEGARLAEETLEINPSSLEALTALAGSHFVAGDETGFEEVRARALAINPAYAGLDVAMAELAVRIRRYAQAVERASAAVELDPAAWEGWGLLGMNQLRLGDVEEGRTSLETAFAGDPYNPWFKNNLDLLDTFERYDIHTTEHFELFLHGDESDLLAVYLAPIAEEAYDSLARRYGGEPDLPVRAELFPYHGDFSVRTLGETGLGALGVSFGRVLVMDSPTARELGDYNWASVFWHELAHTFHLAISDNRVPRWFSEGLAVHEQRKAREGWGHQPNIAFLQALRDGRLKVFSELNDGFMRPDYPAQVGFSYLQASLFFQMVEEEHGFGAIRSMLEAYADFASTEALVERVLGTTMDDLDEAFDDYLHTRFASPLAGLSTEATPPEAAAGIEAWADFVAANPGDLFGRMRLGISLYREGRLDAAESHLREALRIFPTYGGPDSPYWFLARIHRDRGENEEAIAALARMTALSESNYEALVLLAELLEESGRMEESSDALGKAVEIWPYDIELHEKLAQLHTDNGTYDRAVLERRAVVSLDPTDRAEALYLLASAEYAAGEGTAARRSVMRALEIAPNYDEALELLLQIRGSTR